MASVAHPVREGIRGPNIASADVQLPAVRDYEQVDRDIIATLGFTKKWFLGLSIANWSFIAFAVFTVVLLLALFKAKR